MRAVALVLAGFLAGCGAARHAPQTSGADPAYAPPTDVERVPASVHQLVSSTGSAFSTFLYEVPTADSVPHIIAVDERDQVWFSESGGRFARGFLPHPEQSRVARLDQNGTISEWELSTEGSSPMGVAFSDDGTLWVAERLANRITRMSPDGEIEHYAVPTPDAWPTGLALDAEGRVWFTETMGDHLGMVDPASGRVREWPLPEADARATGIAIGHDGRVWIAERDHSTIGSFDPRTEEFRRYPLPTADAKPCGVAVDQDGTLWFSERNGGKIGRIGKGGVIEEFGLDDRFAGPFILAPDKRGKIWFSEIFTGRIGLFDPSDQSFEHFALPGKDTFPAGIALDGKGNLWYALQGSNQVGVLVRTDLSYLGDEEAVGVAPVVDPPGTFEITEHDLPSEMTVPGIVAVDRRGTVWATQMGGGWVGPGFPPGPPGSTVAYYRDGALHELPMPTPESGPTSMALDPCGDDVWVSLRAVDRIARIREGKVTEFQIPVAGAWPVGIAVDHDHAVWVALSNAAQIARLTPEGEWRLLDVDGDDPQPRTVYVDADNQVWFAEKMGNHIGRIDRSTWTAERWQIPTEMAWPLSLVADSSGKVWFAEMRADKLARFDPETGVFTEYDLPVQSAPFKLLLDEPNRAMWLSTVFYNAILRFDLDREEIVAVYSAPSEGAWVGGLDRDPDGCIWFSEQFANRLGRLCIDDVKVVGDAVTESMIDTADP